MLDHHQITRYLLQRGLVETTSIVNGDLIVDAEERLRICKVIRMRGPSYLLKRGGDLGDQSLIGHEAAIYRLLWSPPLGRELGRYLPHCYSYDAQTDTLVLEFIRDARDLRAYHAQLGRFPVGPAREMGRALGALHHLTRTQPAADGDIAALAQSTDQPPWVLGLHRPGLNLFRNASEASIDLIKTIQSSVELCQRLDELCISWQRTALIHNDLKWDNCLVRTAEHGARSTDLRIVDWELAQVGDPCWDAGSVFTDYLNCWLSSIPLMREVPMERLVQMARYPIERMQPALRAFWLAYVQRMQFGPELAERWLLRAVAFSAARLIQTAFEYLQEAEHTTSRKASLLQLSLNILRRPEETAVHLLGIPLRMVSTV